ncbi:hypothetical protein Tco_1500965 [Tanacetum coccineum]
MLKEELNTGKEEINTGMKRLVTVVLKLSLVTCYKSGQEGEGKAPMIEEDIQATHKTKEQMRQEEAGLEEAIKLQAQLDEEVAKQIHLDKMVAKRMAEEEALSEQQKKRKVQLEANAELTKDVLGKDLPEQDFAKRMAEMVNQRKKHFAEERAKAKRNKPMTSHSLKNQYVELSLKNQKLGAFSLKEVEVRRNQRSSYIRDKVAEVKEEESVKTTGKRKKQKARKVVNWKIFQQGQRSIYQIMRANRADTKYGTNRPEDAYDRVLWNDLRTMFDPPLNEGAIWSLPLQQKMVKFE